jgi:hypothetical protein
MTRGLRQDGSSLDPSVSGFHKNGGPHLHLFVDRFIPQAWVTTSRETVSPWLLLRLISFYLYPHLRLTALDVQLDEKVVLEWISHVLQLAQSRSKAGSQR